jgi:hypothetical protein
MQQLMINSNATSWHLIRTFIFHICNDFFKVKLIKKVKFFQNLFNNFSNFKKFNIDICSIQSTPHKLIRNAKMSCVPLNNHKSKLDVANLRYTNINNICLYLVFSSKLSNIYCQKNFRKRKAN